MALNNYCIQNQTTNYANRIVGSNINVKTFLIGLIEETIPAGPNWVALVNPIQFTWAFGSTDVCLKINLTLNNNQDYVDGLYYYYISFDDASGVPVYFYQTYVFGSSFPYTSNTSPSYTINYTDYLSDSSVNFKDGDQVFMKFYVKALTEEYVVLAGSNVAISLMQIPQIDSPN